MTDTYTLHLKVETAAALGVYEDDPDELVWLPRSQVTLGRLVRSGPHPIYEIEIPDWLAEKTGLV